VIEFRRNGRAIAERKDVIDSYPMNAAQPEEAVKIIERTAAYRIPNFSIT
jgi:hypothetical protein